jgi:hypothetical protein
MALSDAARRRLHELLSALSDGRCDDEQRQHLLEMLADPDAQRHYVAYAMLDACLDMASVEHDQPEERSAADRTGAKNPLQPHAPHILGFLNRLLRIGHDRPAANALAWLVMAGLCSGAVLTLLMGIVLIFNGGNLPSPSGREAGGEGLAASQSAVQPSSIIHHPSVPVGRLVRAVDCRWADGAQPVEVGESLAAGRQLRLESGFAEISCTKGAELLLQGPATLTIESELGVFLTEGRLNTRLTSPEAHGFTVRTPQSDIVDEGTEFGVDVAPGGDQSVHVFQGKVEFSATSKDGKAVLRRHLFANEGTRVQAETSQIDLLADSGEGFTRSIDKTGHDRHTVAYWRFEDRPVGTLVPNSSRSRKDVRGTVDCSGNGNDLFTWGEMTAPRFSADVPAAAIPQTGLGNHSALDYSAPLPPKTLSRELYTNSAFSHASPIDIQKISPRAWTIEASVKAASLSNATQTFVARGGDKPWVAVPLRLAFSVQKIKGVPRFAISFYDADGRHYEAVADRLRVEKDRWYNVAATSDGKALRLFVDSLDGHGYRVQAAKALAADGNTALGKGTELAQWTVGRGLKNNGVPGVWFQGFIDEVRISDVARDAADFLFAARRPEAESLSLDLVDIVAGGNGLTHRRNRAINPTNGLYDDEPHGRDNNARPKQGTIFLADYHYHRVPSNPLVNGVFIVAGDETPVQVDSAGNCFAGFGRTGSETSNPIGGVGATGLAPAKFGSGEAPYFAAFGGADYSSAGHGLIYVRSNKGITFDLEAIRRAHPAYKLLAFTAVAGNPQPKSDRRHFGDLWVLVDAQPRFERRKVTVGSGEIPIDVALAPSDRFLTLATTDGGGTIWNNWSMFGDPKLRLRQADGPGANRADQSPVKADRKAIDRGGKP